MKIGALSDESVQKKLQSYILVKVQRSDKETSKRHSGFYWSYSKFLFYGARSRDYRIY